MPPLAARARLLLAALLRPPLGGALGVPALLLVTLLVGFRGLSARSLWDDEVTTLEYARKPPAEIWRERDPNLSPFYYLLVRAWRRAVGEDEAALRALSAAGRVLGLLALVALGAATLGGRSAAVAGLLYASSPAALLYGQELRPYPWLLAASCSGLACLWAAHPARRLRWAVLAGVAFAVSLMLHYSTLFLLGGLFVAHLLPPLRDRRWALGVALGVAALSVIPWAGVFVENLSNLLAAATGHEQVPVPFGPPGKAAYALFVLVLGETVLPWSWLVVPAAVGSAVLSIVGWRALADRRDLRAFLVLPLALSVAGLSLTMKAGPRYAFLFLPCLLALFAAGRGRPWLAALLAVLLGEVVSCVHLFEGREYHNQAMVEPGREVAAFLRKEIREGDLLVYTSYPKPLLHYLGAPPEPRFLSWAGKAEIDRESGTETFEELVRAAEGRRVWVVERSPGRGPRAGPVEARAEELRAALARRSDGCVTWPFGHDPDAEAKRRWTGMAFLDDRIVVRRYDPR